MKILLSARGSRGDVAPIIAVARGLQERGHDAVICVPGTFEAAVREAGLRSALYSEDSQQMMQGFGSGWAGLKNALAWFSRTIDEQFEVMIAESEGADLLLTGTNEIAAPCVAEHRGIAHYRVTFAPMMTGYQAHPLLPWQHLPGVVNRAAWTGINLGVDLLARGPINRNRAALGLAPIKGVGEYVARYGHTLFSMNTTLAPPCPSWGRRYDFTFTGYCHPAAPRDGEGDGLPQELSRFIQAAVPPLFLGFGSVSVKDPKRFTTMVLDAVALSGCRVVLSSGWTGLGRGALSDNVYVVGDLPHEALFPRVAAVLHHGGAGTTHTAARAGVPQLVMPQFADQHYWGHRVAALGLGPAPIAPTRLSCKRLARALRALVEDRRYARHAAALGHAMRDEDGVAGVVSVVEQREGGGVVTPATRGGEAASAGAS